MTYYERNLPHWVPPGKDLFVTWRLNGSLPVAVMDKLRKRKTQPAGERFVRFERELDRATSGPTWLGDAELARIVVAAIRESGERGLCMAHAFVVMPNHVHLLLEPRVALEKITRAIKGGTARACNLALGRTGKPFWQDESFDHWVRGSASFERIRRYIEANPVSAGLVKRPEEWPWSSAAR